MRTADIWGNGFIVVALTVTGACSQPTTSAPEHPGPDPIAAPVTGVRSVQVTRSEGTFACLGTPLENSPWTLRVANYAFCASGQKADSLEALASLATDRDALRSCQWLDVGTPFEQVPHGIETGASPWDFPISSDACNASEHAIFGNGLGYILKSHTDAR